MKIDNGRPVGRLSYLLISVVVSAAAVLSLAGVARAQGPATTLVSDNIYRADGTPAQGTLLISWPAFTTSANQAVSAGALSLQLGAGGALAVNLAPNEGARPDGSYYKVVYKLADGTTATEFWVVPAATPTNVAGVRATVVPASIAAQYVTKTWLDQILTGKADETAVVHLASAESITGAKTFSASPQVPTPVGASDAANKEYVDSALTAATANYVAKAGDTMGGPLFLNSDPSAPGMASNRHYVDASIATVNGVVAQLPEQQGNVKAFGAVGDGVVLNDGAMTSGSAVLTSASASFSSSDIGKKIDVNGAGAASCGLRYYSVTGSTFSCNLVTTIASVQSATQVTLAAAAGTTVTAAQVAYGTDDRAAIQAAIDSGAALVYFPRGTYVVGAPGVKAVMKGRTLRGDGPGVSRLLQIGGIAYNASSAFNTILIDNGSSDVLVQGLGFLGTNTLGELTTFGTTTSDGLMVCSGAPAGLGGLCNSQSAIDNIRVRACAFDHHWGIGFHIPGTSRAAGQQVTNVSLADSEASFNSYDGFNPSAYDGMKMVNLVATDNGTGGIEATSYGTMSLTGSTLLRNKLVGAVAGGLLNTGHANNVVIADNVASENGNGYPANATGIGLSATDGVENLILTGNTVRHNGQIGIELNADPRQDGNWMICGNTISTNGYVGQPNASYGIYGPEQNAIVCGNMVVNEDYSEIASVSRASNVVTVTTRGPHNYAAGYSVTLSGVTDASFNGTFTIATVTDGTHFTFAQTAADASSSGGHTYSTGSGFEEKVGIGVNGSVNTIVTGNHVRPHPLNDYNFFSGTNAVLVDWEPHTNNDTTALTYPTGTFQSLNVNGGGKLNLASGAATPTTSGDIWNASGVPQWYTGSATKQLAFTDSFAQIATAGQGYFFGVTVQAPQGTTTDGLSGSANQMRVAQFVLTEKATISKVTVDVTTASASSSGDVGLYDASGNRLAYTNAGLSTATTGVKTATLAGGAVTLNPGVYYLGYCDTSSSVQALAVASATVGNAFVSSRWGNASNACSAGALPATIGTVTNVGTNPVVAMFEP